MSGRRRARGGGRAFRQADRRRPRVRIRHRAPPPGGCGARSPPRRAGQRRRAGLRCPRAAPPARAGARPLLRPLLARSAVRMASPPPIHPPSAARPPGGGHAFRMFETFLDQ
eukprot:scaffold2502_cov362-Prasinococcus_capsulatus_cf.AAC.12